MRKIQFIHEGKRITHIELFKLVNNIPDIIMPIEVIDEIFSHITCGKTFKEILHTSKYFHCNYESLIPQYISVSIIEVMGMLENATFYYEILTDRIIDAELSCDQLYRHTLGGFGCCETDSYDIVTVGKGERYEHRKHQNHQKQYLTMTLRLEDFYYEDGDEATPKNITMYFPETSIDGKFIIPKSFGDEMYVVNPDDSDDYETIVVDMRFDKVEGDVDLLQYITIV